MARIQIITAVTLDGYLPDPNEELLQWVKTDSQGFPFWHERSTFTLFPGYPMLDLICEKDEKPDSFTFTSEISDPKSLDLLHGLSIYHLIDEIIIYILPLTTGKVRTACIDFRSIVGNFTGQLLSKTGLSVSFIANPRDSPLHPARKSCNLQDSPFIHFYSLRFLFH